jgi:protein NirF
VKKTILFIVFICTSLVAGESVFVVERESSSLAVIDNQKLVGRIENMHDMNHGVVKFHQNDGYAITRDGYVIKINPKTLEIVAEYKTSKSAIGFVVEDDFIAVANYDDKSVDILDRDLNPLQKLGTNSRNVGIRTYKNFLIFAEMDNDRITILRRNPSKEPFFVFHHSFNDVGVMPFDAMVENHNYIVGFFKSDYFGVIDLETMQFNRISITAQNNRPVLKVPHFGFWSLGSNQIYIPAVGDNKVLVYDQKFNFIKNIETVGLPVFTSLSPDNQYLAVTYSGKEFPYIEIVDTKTLEVIKKYKFDGKVLHVRWSSKEQILYVSVNDTNKVAVINTSNWAVKQEIQNVKKPSGIFLFNRS